MKVLAYIGVFVLLVSLSFPLSAGAFGRSPSSSEVNQTGTIHTTAKKSTASITTTNPNGTPGTPQAVPEPSSFMLLAVAFGLIAVVSLKRLFGQVAEK